MTSLDRSGRQCPLDERRLPINVSLTISRIPRCQFLLEGGVGREGIRVRAQIITECEVIAPEVAVDLGQMNVVLPRIAAAEEIASRDSLFAAVGVARRFESGDARAAILLGPASRE